MCSRWGLVRKARVTSKAEDVDAAVGTANAEEVPPPSVGVICGIGAAAGGDEFGRDGEGGDAGDGAPDVIMWQDRKQGGSLRM